MKITIHRGTGQIGGNCVELRTALGERLLLDAGRPLDTPVNKPTPVPSTLNIAEPVSGVLLSHAHADHCGMLQELPSEWSVYCGKTTETLLCLSAATGGKTVAQPCFNWEHKKPITIGSFTVTPYLVDHSAFDAYALQIDAEGKTVLYSGDFRAHGRKAKLTYALMRKPPKKVDALIMEGTNLFAADSAPKPTIAEAELEKEFIRLFKECHGRVFVSWSSTNIDRSITLYRACIQSGRVLIPDLYCMYVLTKLKEYPRIPQPEWKNRYMKTVVTTHMASVMKKLGEEGFIKYLQRYWSAMSAKKLLKDPQKWVIMARGSLLEDYASKGVKPNERDVWVWSMWNGALEQDSTRAMREFFAPCRREYIHSSGHASPDILKEFAEAIKPDMLIPVHGESWPAWAEQFPNVKILTNGEWIELSQ